VTVSQLTSFIAACSPTAELSRSLAPSDASGNLPYAAQRISASVQTDPLHLCDRRTRGCISLACGLETQIFKVEHFFARVYARVSLHLLADVIATAPIREARH
jgi:hypothetical protein